MIDIHHHLIHQIDDGAQTFDETKDMLRIAQDQGISHIIATPHAVPGQQCFQFDHFMHHLSMAQSWCHENGIPITLYPGAEIFYTDDTLRLLQEKRIPTLANSRYVLLEFSSRASFDHLRKAADTLGSAGYYCIFAHIERYDCLKKLKNIRVLREQDQVLIQMNAHTTLTSGNILKTWWINRVLKEGLIDIIASDAHHPHFRRCHMEESFEKISVLYGQDYAQKLFYDHAAVCLNLE